jgi:hypothetical protein
MEATAVPASIRESAPKEISDERTDSPETGYMVSVYEPEEARDTIFFTFRGEIQDQEHGHSAQPGIANPTLYSQPARRTIHLSGDGVAFRCRCLLVAGDGLQVPRWARAEYSCRR